MDEKVSGETGIYLCDVVCPKSLINPQLPRRADGKLHWDLVDRDQRLTSVDIERARVFGYRIEVVPGYLWSESANIFEGYICSLFEIKAAALKGTAAYAVAKLCMNGLYGQVCQRPIFAQTQDCATPDEILELLRDGNSITDFTQFGAHAHVQFEPSDPKKLNTASSQRSFLVHSCSFIRVTSWLDTWSDSPIREGSQLHGCTQTQIASEFILTPVV
jgi:hypothetical protein